MIVAGLGKKSSATTVTLRRVAARCFSAHAAKSSGVETIAVQLPAFDGVSAAECTQITLEGVLLSGYKFDKYITTGKDSRKKHLKKVLLLVDANEALKPVQKSADFTRHLCDGVTLTRDLANAPRRTKFTP